MTDNNSELDSILTILRVPPFPKGRYVRTKSDDLAISEAKAAINQLLLKARRDELAHVQLEHGHYVTQTFVKGSAMTLQERIAELDKEIAQ